MTVDNGSVDLTFDEVTTPGFTTVDACDPGTPPTGFRLGAPPVWYCIETTATFTGMVEVCITYDESAFSQPEENFKLFHFPPGSGGQGVDITTSLDTVNNIICGSTDSFSDFAVVEPESEGPEHHHGNLFGCATVRRPVTTRQMIVNGAFLLLPLLGLGLLRRRRVR